MYIYIYIEMIIILNDWITVFNAKIIYVRGFKTHVWRDPQQTTATTWSHMSQKRVDYNMFT